MSKVSETYTPPENILKAFVKDLLTEELQNLNGASLTPPAPETEPTPDKQYVITMKSGRVFFHSDSRSCHEFSNAIATKDKNINTVVRFVTCFAPGGDFSLNVAEIESIEELSGKPQESE